MLLWIIFFNLLMLNSAEILTESGEAFITLFYSSDEGYLLAVRVLGQSLRESAKNHAHVVITLPDVSEEVSQVLRNDGWKVITLDPSTIPYNGAFKGHVAKLLMLTLTQYSKLCFVDADAIAFPGIDDIFNCGRFCAVLRHSNIFNSGIMVTSPNKTQFHEIIKMLENWDYLAHPHKGGDQDIFNSYYHQLKFAPVYDRQKPTPTRGYSQLPFEYNMDAGIYYLRSGWLLPRSEYRIMHYTFISFRPWMWVIYPVFDLNWEWNELRHRLPDGGGTDMFPHPILKLFAYFPVVFSLIKIFWYSRYYRFVKSVILSPRMQMQLSACAPYVIQNSRFFSLFAVLIAFSISLLSIPEWYYPLHGWALFFIDSMFYHQSIMEALCWTAYISNPTDIDCSNCRLLSQPWVFVKSMLHFILFYLLLAIEIYSFMLISLSSRFFLIVIYLICDVVYILTIGRIVILSWYTYGISTFTQHTSPKTKCVV